MKMKLLCVFIGFALCVLTAQGVLMVRKYVDAASEPSLPTQGSIKLVPVSTVPSDKYTGGDIMISGTATDLTIEPGTSEAKTVMPNRSYRGPIGGGERETIDLTRGGTLQWDGTEWVPTERQVKALGESGAICEVYGHNWQYPKGMQLGDLHRSCLVCSMNQTERNAWTEDAE